MRKVISDNEKSKCKGYEVGSVWCVFRIEERLVRLGYVKESSGDVCRLDCAWKNGVEILFEGKGCDLTDVFKS